MCVYLHKGGKRGVGILLITTIKLSFKGPTNDFCIGPHIYLRPALQSIEGLEFPGASNGWDWGGPPKTISTLGHTISGHGTADIYLYFKKSKAIIK